MLAYDTRALARLFPAPAVGTGSVPVRGQNQESASRLLHFVDRRFTFAQRVFGWNLDPETRLGRVLLLRRQAFEAERAGAFRMADFLWVEAHRALKNAAADPMVWRHALDISAFSPAITPEILRTRFIQELFIDLHRAVFDSRRAAAAIARSGRSGVRPLHVRRAAGRSGRFRCRHIGRDPAADVRRVAGRLPRRREMEAGDPDLHGARGAIRAGPCVSRRARRLRDCG